VNRTTTARIAEAALRILEKEGPQAVSMRRVASAVGITPMAIYHHFPNRQALLTRITDAEFSRLLAFIRAHPPRGASPERLVTLMEGYVDYALARPRLFDYVFSQPRPDARQFPRDFRARRSTTSNIVADTVAHAMQEGFLRKDDVWEVAFAIWAHVHGHIALYRAGRIGLTEKQFRALVRRSLRRFLHGLAA
jgi:AcrR family transcriptional regulator